MSGSASKRKGKSWENDVAKHLSALYGESFIRVPFSGAYIGGKNVHRKEFLHEGQIRNMKGDIIPPMNWLHFNAECKSYADFPFHQLYQGDIKILETWLGQLLEVADHNDYNILIMKFNRKGKFIASQAPALDFEQNYSTYNSPSYGQWIIQDYDTFWKNNQEHVRLASLKS
jgi:hypothetical protein